MPSSSLAHPRVRDKENMAPSSRAFGLSSSSSSNKRAAQPAHASDDDDQYVDRDDNYNRRKKVHASSSTANRPSAASRPNRYTDDRDELRAVKKSAPQRPRQDQIIQELQTEEERPWSDEQLLTERKAYDQWVEKKLSKLGSKREKMLEDDLDRIKNERDQIQGQYDELRQLRHTVPEHALEDFKRTAESRYRHDKDLISSLKSKVEAAEKRARESSGAPDRSASILANSVRDSVQPDLPDFEEMEKKHRRELADAARAQRKLEDEVRTYKLQLEQEIAQSKALLAAASNGSSTAAAVSRTAKSAADTNARLSLPASEHETAVRKLYEDLTGIVITGVEEIHSDQSSKAAPAKAYKRFKAVFAQEGYHSLSFSLEESHSVVQDDDVHRGKKHLRQDMVYVPTLDEDRDRALLDDDGVPKAWKESIRFVKTSLFTWYEKTRKILRTDDNRRR